MPEFQCDRGYRHTPVRSISWCFCWRLSELRRKYLCELWRLPALVCPFQASRGWMVLISWNQEASEYSYSKKTCKISICKTSNLTVFHGWHTVLHKGASSSPSPLWWVTRCRWTPLSQWRSNGERKLRSALAFFFLCCLSGKAPDSGAKQTYFQPVWLNKWKATVSLPLFSLLQLHTWCSLPSRLFFSFHRGSSLISLWMPAANSWCWSWSLKCFSIFFNFSRNILNFCYKKKYIFF